MMYMSRPFRVSARKGLQLVEQLKTARGICKSRGGARGGGARLELDQMPRDPLQRKG